MITDVESDLLSLMKQTDSKLLVVRPDDASTLNFDKIGAIAILGGGGPKPLLLLPPLRKKIEAEILKGKRVFTEFVRSIGDVYFESPTVTRFSRLAVVQDGWLPNESKGALIDDQYGERIRPHIYMCSQEKPLLSFITTHSHDRIRDSELDWEVVNKERALWFEKEGQLLICAFRLANFYRARHAPKSRIKKVISFVLQWLYGTEIEIGEFPEYYRTGSNSRDGMAAAEYQEIEKSVERSLLWVKRSGVLRDDGHAGALEGLGTEINYQGHQELREIRRADCIGELSFSYWLHSLKTGIQNSRKISNNLINYVLDHYIHHDDGPLQGMFRWTDEAWGVCYQDDAARALLPQLFRNFYEETTERLDECLSVLDFLVRTTGTDGTRVFRTDNIHLSSNMLHKLQNTPGNLPSAHYNAFYYAALCIAFRLTGRNKYRDTAVAGLTTIMTHYPETKREQSQTQELCRLILPLSWLYEVTGVKEHLNWLYKVAHDLQQYYHPSGAYLEWDDGYQASMRHSPGSGESSLLSTNGDPVADLLYSNNWLPIGWIQAYFITGDEWFKKLWEDTVRFMVNAQIESEDIQIDGAWARAFDVEKMEVFGSPADVGWGPWSIESGWTVGEITSGLLMGLLESTFLPKHKN